jgi:hypothetical protein
MVLVTSPSSNEDSLSEQTNSLLNESTDKVNLSSLSFLQTKQRRIDHRRNKSEPFRSLNVEDICSTRVLDSSSASTTSNESPLSNNASIETKQKCSIKVNSNNISPTTNGKQTLNNSSQIADRLSSVSSSTKKKKSWYNVSFTYLFCFHIFIHYTFYFHRFDDDAPTHEIISSPNTHYFF